VGVCTDNTRFTPAAVVKFYVREITILPFPELQLSVGDNYVLLLQVHIYPSRLTNMSIS